MTCAAACACTRCYYDAPSFEEDFAENAAFQRACSVAKLPAGRGRLVRPADETTYCANYGDRELRDDEALVLMEMCDNHVERHTVG